MSLNARRTYRRLMRRCRHKDDEAGAALVIFVIAIVALMAFTAMAVDLGNIGQTKEHTETAVQDAALSAVGQLSTLFVGGTGVATTQEGAAVTVAENYLSANYAGLTPTFFMNNPTACQGELPSTIYIWPAQDCFGFFDPSDPTNTALGETNPTAMAVAIPTRNVSYTFGHAAGLTQQAVSSVAYALLEPANGHGGFPFSYSNNGQTGLQCVKNGSGGSLPQSCTGFTSQAGNYGVINSPRYRIFPGFDNSGGANGVVIPTDLVLGIDHALNGFGDPPAGGVEYCDQWAPNPNSNCRLNNYPTNLHDWANAVMGQTGQDLNVLTGPLFTGTGSTLSNCTLDPLLSHPDGFVATNDCTADNPYRNGTGVPKKPWLLGSNGDTFGASSAGYPDLNGVQISAYLDCNGNWLTSNGRTASASPCANVGQPTSLGAWPPTGCMGTLPNNATGQNLASVDAIDVTDSSGTNYIWSGGQYPANGYASYDDCLSTIMRDLGSNPLGNPPSCSPAPSSTTLPCYAIFSPAIENSPRFGQVPVICATCIAGSTPQDIVGFVDIYLDVVFPKTNNSVGAIEAWVFPQWMIDNAPGYHTGGTGFSGGSFIPTLCNYLSTPC